MTALIGKQIGSINVPSHVLCQEVDDEAVLLDLGRGHYFGLNDLGTQIWRLLGGGLSKSELYCALLQEGYAVSDEDLKRDLDGFLEELASRGLIDLELSS